MLPEHARNLARAVLHWKRSSNPGELGVWISAWAWGVGTTVRASRTDVASDFFHGHASPNTLSSMLCVNAMLWIFFSDGWRNGAKSYTLSTLSPLAPMLLSSVMFPSVTTPDQRQPLPIPPLSVYVYRETGAGGRCRRNSIGLREISVRRSSPKGEIRGAVV